MNSAQASYSRGIRSRELSAREVVTIAFARELSVRSNGAGRDGFRTPVVHSRDGEIHAERGSVSLTGATKEYTDGKFKRQC